MNQSIRLRTRRYDTLEYNCNISRTAVICLTIIILCFSSTPAGVSLREVSLRTIEHIGVPLRLLGRWYYYILKNVFWFLPGWVL